MTAECHYPNLHSSHLEKTWHSKRSNTSAVRLESALSQVAREVKLSQFAKWHCRKPDRPNIAGEGARAFRSEGRATANCILGKLASFSTVFVVKLEVTGLSYRQPGFVKSFPTVVRCQFWFIVNFAKSRSTLREKNYGNNQPRKNYQSDNPLYQRQTATLRVHSARGKSRRASKFRHSPAQNVDSRPPNYRIGR